MAACIAEGRLAPANGRNPGHQDRQAALFALSWSQNGAKNPPQKQGRSIPGRRKGFGLDKASPSFTVCMYVMYVSMYVCNVCMYVCVYVCMYVM